MVRKWSQICSEYAGQTPCSDSSLFLRGAVLIGSKQTRFDVFKVRAHGIGSSLLPAVDKIHKTH